MISNHNGHIIRSLKEEKYQQDLQKNLENLKKNIKHKLSDIANLKVQLKHGEDLIKQKLKNEKKNLITFQESLTNNKNYDFFLKTIKSNHSIQLKALGDITERIDSKLKYAEQSAHIVKEYIKKLSTLSLLNQSESSKNMTENAKFNITKLEEEFQKNCLKIEDIVIFYNYPIRILI